MQDSFTPLMSEVVDSTLWEEDLAVRVLFVSMLALKGPDHVVRMPMRRLAKKSNMGPAEVERALKVLMSPDEMSTDEQEHGGRRIEAVADGWLVLNGAKYQQMMFDIMRRSRRAEAQRERRAAARGTPLTNEVAAVAAEEAGDHGLADRLAAERRAVADPRGEVVVPGGGRTRKVRPEYAPVVKVSPEFSAKMKQVAERKKQREEEAGVNTVQMDSKNVSRDKQRVMTNDKQSMQMRQSGEEIGEELSGVPSGTHAGMAQDSPIVGNGANAPSGLQQDAARGVAVPGMSPSGAPTATLPEVVMGCEASGCPRPARWLALEFVTTPGEPVLCHECAKMQKGRKWLSLTKERHKVLMDLRAPLLASGVKYRCEVTPGCQGEAKWVPEDYVDNSRVQMACEACAPKLVGKKLVRLSPDRAEILTTMRKRIGSQP